MNCFATEDHMARPTDAQQKALELLAEKRMATTQELEAAGVSRATITRMKATGEITQVSRGVYAAKDADEMETTRLAAVYATKQPLAIVCMETAAYYHGIGGSKYLDALWLMIPRDTVGTFRLGGEALPLAVKTIKASDNQLTYGIEAMEVYGRQFGITSIARTVADLFKFKRRNGGDLAFASEALWEAVANKGVIPDEIMQMAVLAGQHTDKLIKPYIDEVLERLAAREGHKPC